MSAIKPLATTGVSVGTWEGALDGLELGAPEGPSVSFLVG
jgi:hypothetical protein